MRTAIYARYSTELQNEKSIEDQVALCRAHAAREGLEIVQVYSDRARSGASLIGRDGILELLLAAKSRAFDVVLTESLDRISRDQQDLLGVYKQLDFNDVQIRTVHGGAVDVLQAGISGLIGQIQLVDTRRKVHRGMTGVVASGRHAGGRAYGYRPVPGQPGQLAIVDKEAAIVREIFAAYIGGQTPRQIVASLNARKVAAPRGREWVASAINGSRTRLNGMIMNRLYSGTLIWNRLRMVKDPDTGKRVPRLNPESDWKVMAVPHLRLVDQETFDAAQNRKVARGGARPHTQRKERHLSSGRLVCGTCGSNMVIKDRRNGVVRVQCSRMKESGSCSNRASYDLTLIETLMFDGLRKNLEDPALIAQFVEEYNAERKRLAADLTARRNSIERRLAQARREIDRMVDAVAKGLLEDSEVAARIPALREERKRLETELAGADTPPNVVALHPATVQRYREQVENLSRTLNNHMLEGDQGPANAFRSLVSSIIVHPKREDGTFEIEVKGKLAALLQTDVFPNARIVAGGGSRKALGVIGGSGGPFHAIP